MSCCGSALLLESQLGTAYQNVRVVAENIDALLALVAGNDVNPNVLSLLKGTTSIIANGVVDIDLDNSYFSVNPEVGLTDNITTFSGAENGRVIIVRPAQANQTLTLKPVTTKAITGISVMSNELIADTHGLSLAQEIRLSGDIPGVANGVYYAVPTGVSTFKIASTKVFALANTIIDVYENGTGQLHIGNINILADVKVENVQTIILVKDGDQYVVLSSAGGGSSSESIGTIQTQISNIENDITNINGELGTKQDIDPILTALSALNMTGNANEVIQLNSSANGFVFTPLSSLGGAHTHVVGDVTGLQAALDGKASTTHTHSGFATASHNHDTVYQKKATISTANPSGGANGDIWFKVT